LFSINSDNTILSNPKIVEVVISILSERGYAVTMDERVHETPKRVDPKTFEIILER
jgi:adenylate kinase